MDLPPDLRAAIDAEVESLPSSRLAALAADLSERYRAGLSSGVGKLLRSREDTAAYVAFRLPATFAAAYSALSQVEDRLPEWSPQTLLDVGAGPSTAMWAATTLWPELKHVALLEREEEVVAFGKRLAAHSLLASVREAKWLTVDITAAWETPPCDLVIVAYVLGELPGDPGGPLIRKLWESTRGTLVIIEPGTPAGFSRVRQAREQLLDAGAKSIAPCPHDEPCPLADNDWCHFAQRVARSRLHREVKAGELSYEDEKFSLVAMSRTTGTAIQGRVIRHPQVRPGHIRLEVCRPEGLTNTVITRKDRESFRKARDLRWGSAVRSSDGIPVWNEPVLPLV